MRLLPAPRVEAPAEAAAAAAAAAAAPRLRLLQVVPRLRAVQPVLLPLRVVQLGQLINLVGPVQL